MVFLDSLYSPPHPHHFQLLSAEKYVSLVCVFFINRAKKRQFLLYCRRSPRWHLQFSQRFALCITIHTPPSQFTKIYNISYKLIHSLQLYVFLYIFRPLYHNPHFPITILTTTKLTRQGKENARCAWHQKLFLLFMTHLFYWGKKWQISGRGDVDKKTLPKNF